MAQDEPLANDSVVPQSEGSTEKEFEEELAEYLADGKLDDGELDVLAENLTALENLPDEERDRRLKDFLVAFQRQVIEIEATEGPIPPPKMLAGYESALPGAANRILTMAEAQQSHRHDIESKVIQGNIDSERLGVTFGGAIAIILLLGAIILIAIGRSVEGLALVATEAVAIAGVFVKTSSNAKNELRVKGEQADSNSIRSE